MQLVHRYYNEVNDMKKGENEKLEKTGRRAKDMNNPNGNAK